MTMLTATFLFVRNALGLQPYLVLLGNGAVELWVLVQCVHVRIFLHSLYLYMKIIMSMNSIKGNCLIGDLADPVVLILSL